MIRPFYRVRCLGVPLMFFLIAFGCSTVRTTVQRQGSETPTPPGHADQKQAPAAAPPAIAHPPPLAAMPPHSRAQAATYFVHRVRQRGETLSSIAAWYTGSGKNWKQIARANSGLNPRRIHIGDAIRIPEHLLVTRRPMPKKSMPAAATAKSPPTPAKPPGPTHKIQLFGPIDPSPLQRAPKDPGSARPVQTLD